MSEQVAYLVEHKDDLSTLQRRLQDVTGEADKWERAGKLRAMKKLASANNNPATETGGGKKKTLAYKKSGARGKNAWQTKPLPKPLGTLSARATPKDESDSEAKTPPSPAVFSESKGTSPGSSPGSTPPPSPGAASWAQMARSGSPTHGDTVRVQAKKSQAPTTFSIGGEATTMRTRLSRAEVMQLVTTHFDRGTFDTALDSAVYHFNKHAAKDPDYTIETYIREALKVMESPASGSGQSVTRPGSKNFYVRTADTYLVYTDERKILSFRNRGKMGTRP